LPFMFIILEPNSLALFSAESPKRVMLIGLVQEAARRCGQLLWKTMAVGDGESDDGHPSSFIPYPIALLRGPLWFHFHETRIVSRTCCTDSTRSYCSLHETFIYYKLGKIASAVISFTKV
jgi:hypothetical protein